MLPCDFDVCIRSHILRTATGKVVRCDNINRLPAVFLIRRLHGRVERPAHAGNRAMAPQ